MSGAFRRFGVSWEHLFDDDDVTDIVHSIPNAGASAYLVLSQLASTQSSATTQQLAAIRVRQTIVRRLREVIVAASGVA